VRRRTPEGTGKRFGQLDARWVEEDRPVADDTCGDGTGLIAPVVDNDAARRVDDQVMAQGWKTEIVSQLAAGIALTGPGRNDFDDNQVGDRLNGIVVQRSVRRDRHGVIWGVRLCFIQVDHAEPRNAVLRVLLR
jgi:hypothetical protein